MTTAKIKLTPYPLNDFIIVEPSDLALVTNEVKIMKVVETGILNLVRTSKQIGAATYRYTNDSGDVS